MKKTGEDQDENVFFEAMANMPKGKVFVQFRVRDAGDPDFTELTDWFVIVK